MSTTITIEKLVFGGSALGKTDDGQTVFVWNAIPGEEVEIDVIKKKKNFLEAVATKIILPSPDRVEPKETSFLSTSPWQILSYEKEALSKQQIAIETYGRIGGLILQNDTPDIVSAPNRMYGYRNKIEFSFTERDAAVSLAFFERGKKIKIPVDGSALAADQINETARHILAWVNEQKIPLRSLKSLIIRSNRKGQTIAALFIKDRLDFDMYPTRVEPCIGFQLYYSTHKSPASVPTALLYEDGEVSLIESILGTPLSYGIFSFFQVNIPIFEHALKDIAAFVDPRAPLVDFYSGVGSISLPLSKNRAHTILIDNNSDAIDYAKKNIEVNTLLNCEATCLDAEHMTKEIQVDRAIILDPPRSGLHRNVIQALLTKKPKRIIYLSCELSTQARDIALLSQEYRIVFLKLYNFFPRTAHIEGLCVLETV